MALKLNKDVLTKHQQQAHATKEFTLLLVDDEEQNLQSLSLVLEKDYNLIIAKDGIEAEVIDLRTLRPLDMETIFKSIRKTNRIVTVEEAWPVCSIGSEICARAAIDCFDHLDAPPAKVSGADVPMPYAANLEKLALPTVDQVVQAAKGVCYA